MNYEAEYSHQFVSLSKIFIYLSIRIYFFLFFYFYFTYLFLKKSKITNQITYFTLHYITLKYQIFLIFKFFFLFSHIRTIIHSLSLVLEYVKKK